MLRERISWPSAASLRITSILDLGTVLQEVVDSACVLTNARYGVITAIDDKGQRQDFVSFVSFVCFKAIPPGGEGPSTR